MKQLLTIKYRNGSVLSNIIDTGSAYESSGRLHFHVFGSCELFGGVPLENISEYHLCKYYNDFNQLVECTGISMKNLSACLEIPYRTIQDWKAGDRVPPSYMMKLICRYLDIQ